MSCRPRFATRSGNQNATRAPLLLSRVTTLGTRYESTLMMISQSAPSAARTIRSWARSSRRGRAWRASPAARSTSSATAAGMSRAKLGDHVAQALQRVAHVLGKVVRGHWPDDTDPRHGSPRLL